MHTSNLEVLEVSLEEVKAKIELSELLDQLHRSPAFKKIILKNYFETKAINLASVAATPMSEAQRDLHQNGLIGISSLRFHFNAIYRDGEQAKQDLAEYELAITEESANV